MGWFMVLGPGRVGKLAGLLSCLALAVGPIGCGSDEAGGVLLVIDSAPEAPRPAEVRLTWIDDGDRVLLRDRPVLTRIPAAGERLGTVFIETSRRDSGERRMVATGIADGRVVSHGLGRVMLAPAERIPVAVRLVAGSPVDLDGNLIPDELERRAAPADAAAPERDTAARPDGPPSPPGGAVDGASPDRNGAPIDAAVTRDSAIDAAGPTDRPSADAPGGPLDVRAPDGSAPDVPVAGVDAAIPGDALVVEPAPVFAVGSFTKAAAGGIQVVPHTLGAAPVAILVWTNALLSGDFAADVRFGMGFGVANGTPKDRSASTFGEAGQIAPNSSRRMAARLVSLVGARETIIAEGNLGALGPTSFTIDWIRNGGGAMIFHYLLVGGPGVSAEVLDWTPPVSGRKSVEIGWKPDALIHLWVGAPYTSYGAANTHGHFGLGVMSAAGQWAVDVQSLDGSTPGETFRSHRRDVGINMQNFSTVRRRGRLASLDATGFSVDFIDTTDQYGTFVATLALKGVAVRADAFEKTTAVAPVRQTITPVGFRPEALLFAGVQEVAANPTSPHANLAFGATDGRVRVASAFSDLSGLNPTKPQAVDRAGRVFLTVDNDDLRIDAEADLVGFEPNGFSLDWITNDRTAPQIFYLAFGRPRP
jgi:hypothetical protein